MTNFDFEFQSHPITSPGYFSCKVPDEVKHELEQSINNIGSGRDPIALTLIGHNEKECELPVTPNLKYFTESLAYEYGKVFGTNPFKVFINDDEDHEYCLSETWVNFSKKHDFNPIHNHAGVFSFVIWVKIPYDLDEELEVYSDKVNCSVNSLFEFSTIDSFGNINNQTIPVDKSYEWEMIFFPAQMMHQVYPFYTSDEFRVSIAGNIAFSVRNKNEM
tara:strand:- start:5161 stop:5814 length:654 start_codon:yes stop_codon:yes gene_type:complete